LVRIISLFSRIAVKNCIAGIATMEIKLSYTIEKKNCTIHLRQYYQNDALGEMVIITVSEKN